MASSHSAQLQPHAHEWLGDVFTEGEGEVEVEVEVEGEVDGECECECECEGEGETAMHQPTTASSAAYDPE